MSCDEYVLQHREEDIRKSYSRSLLGFAINQRGLSAGVLSFGETNTRRRVRNVMNFKKQGKWIGIFAILLVIAVSVICLTNAAGTKETSEQKGEGKVTADNYSQEFKGKDGEISYRDLKNPKKETVVSLVPTGSGFSHDGKSGYLESLDLNVELPEDDGWIQVPISYEEEEDYSTVSYYDGIANTNVELRLWRGEKDGSYGFAVKAHMIRDWSVKCGSKEVPIHIDRGQIGTGDTKGVALSWEYNDIHCSMLAELPDKANDSSLVKAVSYIIERWYASEKK